MHKSPRPAILQRMNPAHGPLLAGRYAIRFFLLTDQPGMSGPHHLAGFFAPVAKTAWRRK